MEEKIMNFKKISIVFLVFLIMFVTTCAVSAEDVDNTATDNIIGNNAEELQSVPENSNNVDEPQAAPVNTNEPQPLTDTGNSSGADTTPKITYNAQPSTVKKIKTKVEAPRVAFKHKKSAYFKIEVEDRYDDDIPIKNTKIKLKIYTGSKYKTYTVKTNSYGVAKFNTKVLGKGTHKVVISSADSRYDIYKTSKIYIGKQYSSVVKVNSKKVLKTKDKVKIRIKYDEDEKEAKVVFAKKAKKTIITKAKFYLKNKFTGRTIVVTDFCEFDDGRWELPDKDFSFPYTLDKVKVYYIKIRNY